MMGHSLWGLVLVLVLGILIWNAVSARRGGNSVADRADSLAILKLRLAKGEITIEEYNTLKSML
jgi:putative membrane protein